MITVCMENLKIYVADDHTLFRRSFIKLLQGFDRIGEIKEASNGKQLFELVRQEIPDVVILDLEMPVWDGAKTCQKIASHYPEVKIIIVSMHDSKPYIKQLLDSGAHAFISKNAEAEEVEAAINSVVDEGVYKNKIMQEAMKYWATGKALIPKKVTLTPQEQKVLKLLCQGHTNRQISLELKITENTTRNHKVKIMKKAGVKNTAELVKFAIQQGLI